VNCVVYQLKSYTAICYNMIEGFGLVFGFFEHSCDSSLRFTDNIHAQNSIASNVTWHRLSEADFLLLSGSRPSKMATISIKPHTVAAGFN
jgi:hypothetical protein